MKKKKHILESIVRLAEIEGLAFQRWGRGVIVLPLSVDLASWRAVPAVLVLLLPAGDGRQSRLCLQWGSYIAPMEHVIRLFDEHWPTLWGSVASEPFARLSVVLRQEITDVPLDTIVDLSETVKGFAAYIESEAATSSNSVEEYFEGIENRNPLDFVGLGYAYVLMRYFLHGSHANGCKVDLEKLRTLARRSGQGDFLKVDAFIAWLGTLQ